MLTLIALKWMDEEACLYIKSSWQELPIAVSSVVLFLLDGTGLTQPLR